MNATDSAVGGRLKQARDAAGYTLADMARQTHMPMRALQALEDGRWSEIGAPVFVRGQLRAYARALGVGLEDEALPAGRVTTSAPALVCHVHVPRYRHVAESLGRRAIYVVLTAALVIPVWLATRTHPDVPVASLDVAPASMGAAGETAPRTALVASIASLPASPVAMPVRIEFSGDSWIQLFAANGAVVEERLLRAGDRRDLDPAGLRRVVLGNSAVVRVLRNGQAVDLAPYTRANVARFTLSSDGSLAPVLP